MIRENREKKPLWKYELLAVATKNERGGGGGGGGWGGMNENVKPMCRIEVRFR